MLLEQNSNRMMMRSLVFGGLLLIASAVLLLTVRDSFGQKTANCSEPFLISETMSNGAKWEMCWEERQAEGIVYHDIHYTTADGIRRKVLAEASLSQLHVPYDDSSKGRFFDVTDKGFGGENLINLRSGECPGELLTGGSSKGKVCQHIDSHDYAYRYEGGGVPAYRMMSSMMLYNVSRAQRYFYKINWEFHDDGTISPSVGATGKLQQFEYVKEATDAGYPHGWQVYDILDDTPNEWNIYGISHTHNYWWRLDFDIAGEGNDLVEEFNFVPEPTAFDRTLEVSTILTETGRPVDPEAFRSWRVKDTEIYNEDGHAISYHLEPNSSNIFRGPSTEPWSENEFYVTVHNPCELYAQRNVTIGGCGENVTDFIADEQPTDGTTDIVVWYGATFHHLPRDEDDKYMPLHTDGFHIFPRGWTSEYISEVNPPTNSNTDVMGVYTSPTLPDARFTGRDGEGLEVPLPSDDPTAVPTATPIPIMRGDVNCDGQVTLVDVILIQRFNGFSITSTTDCDVAYTNAEIYDQSCDLSGDGNCSLVDSVIILQCNVGIDNGYCDLLP